MVHALQVLAILDNTIPELPAGQGETDVAHTCRKLAYYYDKALASLAA
jgi:hypothetical protein